MLGHFKYVNHLNNYNIAIQPYSLWLNIASIVDQDSNTWGTIFHTLNVYYQKFLLI